MAIPTDIAKKLVKHIRLDHHSVLPLPACGQNINGVIYDDHKRYDINQYIVVKWFGDVSTNFNEKSENVVKTCEGFVDDDHIKIFNRSIRYNTRELYIVPGISTVNFRSTVDARSYSYRIKDVHVKNGDYRLAVFTFCDNEYTIETAMSEWSNDGGVTTKYSWDLMNVSIPEVKAMSPEFTIELIMYMFWAKSEMIYEEDNNNIHCIETITDNLENFDIVCNTNDNNTFVHYNGKLYTGTFENEQYSLQPVINMTEVTFEYEITRRGRRRLIPGYISVETHESAMSEINQKHNEMEATVFEVNKNLSRLPRIPKPNENVNITHNHYTFSDEKYSSILIKGLMHGNPNSISYTETVENGFLAEQETVPENPWSTSLFNGTMEYLVLPGSVVQILNNDLTQQEYEIRDIYIDNDIIITLFNTDIQIVITKNKDNTRYVSVQNHDVSSIFRLSLYLHTYQANETPVIYKHRTGYYVEEVTGDIQNFDIITKPLTDKPNRNDYYLYLNGKIYTNHSNDTMVKPQVLGDYSYFAETHTVYRCILKEAVPGYVTADTVEKLVNEKSGDEYGLKYFDEAEEHPIVHLVADPDDEYSFIIENINAPGDTIGAAAHGCFIKLVFTDGKERYCIIKYKPTSENIYKVACAYLGQNDSGKYSQGIITVRDFDVTTPDSAKLIFSTLIDSSVDFDKSKITSKFAFGPLVLHSRMAQALDAIATNHLFGELN